jgi:hypothetical protein
MPDEDNVREFPSLKQMVDRYHLLKPTEVVQNKPKNDLYLDQVCAECHKRLIVNPNSPGIPGATIVEHEDSEAEADHRVFYIVDDWQE